MASRTPRSIQDLETQLKQILEGDESAFAEGAGMIDALVAEASPHRLRYRIDSVIKVVEGKQSDIVLMHATMANERETEQVIVDPVVAGYYDRKKTMSRLEEELKRADLAGDWERATAVAEACIQVLEQRASYRQETTDLKGIETGRLERARPDVYKRLREAHSEASRQTRDLIAATAAASESADPIR